MPSERALPPFSSSFRGGGAPPCAESACFLSPFREYAARSGRAEGLLGRGKKAERHAPLRTPVFCRSTGRQGIRHRQRTARKWDGYPAHGGGRTLGRPAGDDKGTAPGKGTCVRGGGAHGAGWYRASAPARGGGCDPHRSDERQAYSGASATHRTRRGGLRGDFRTRGGSFFLFLCRAFSAGGGFRSLRRRRPSMAGRFALEGISRAAPEARSLLPPGDREGAARAQRLCVFGKEAPPAALWCRASRGMKKAPRNTSAGPCMTEGGGRGKAL